MKVNVHGIDHAHPKIRQQILKETRREVFRQRKALDDDFDAMVLWVLHERFGFGKKRLRRYYDAFMEAYGALRDFYVGEDADGEAVQDGTVCFKAKQDLLKIGVDIAEWNLKSGG